MKKIIKKEFIENGILITFEDKSQVYFDTNGMIK